MDTKSQEMGFLAIEQGELFFNLWDCFAKGESRLSRIELTIDARAKDADAIASIHFASKPTRYYHFRQGRKLAQDICSYLQISMSNTTRIEININRADRALACTAKVTAFLPASFGEFEWQNYDILDGKSDKE